MCALTAVYLKLSTTFSTVAIGPLPAGAQRPPDAMCTTSMRPPKAVIKLVENGTAAHQRRVVQVDRNRECNVIFQLSKLVSNGVILDLQHFKLPRSIMISPLLTPPTVRN